MKPQHIPKKTWNRSGRKRHLTPDEVRTIRTCLKRSGNLRDLAMFSIAIDTMLRSTGILKLRVCDVQDTNKNIRGEFTIQQTKTQSNVTVVLSEKTRETVQLLIYGWELKPNDFLFSNMCHHRSVPLSGSYYRRLVKSWCRMAGIQDVESYSTHSLRRTRAAYIYDKTKDLEAVRQCLGHRDLMSTSAYLGVDVEHALQVSRKFEL